jgi:hypothetical protein
MGLERMLTVAEHTRSIISFVCTCGDSHNARSVTELDMLPSNEAEMPLKVG